MKKTYVIILMVFIAFLCLFITFSKAHKIEIKGIIEIPQSKEGYNYHPIFSPNGKFLITTSADYAGLNIYDLSTGKHKMLTDKSGAGFEVKISADCHTVFFRSNDFESNLTNIYSIDIISGEEKAIAFGLKELNGMDVYMDELVFFDNGVKKIHTFSMDKNVLESLPQKEPIFVSNEDLKIYIYKDGVKTLLEPFGKKDDYNYVWASIAPDNKRILFTVGNDSYITSFDGTNLVKLEDIRAPKWLNNDYIIAMRDKDDGHEYSASDIVALKIDGSIFQQLSLSSEAIKMYPAPSPDGKRVAFHTVDGRIYLMNLEY